jgi:phosphoribosylamine---glycine ligase
VKVLVLGSGAREHTIAWKFAQSKRIAGLYIAPGNAGTEEFGENLPDIDAADTESILKACKDKKIDLVFIGPEDPLAAGLVDALAQSGIAAIGPHKAAAALESSKTFSKEFMHRYKIPTADAVEFDNHLEFEKHIAGSKGKLVVKKSGLAAGKGVLESEDKKALISFGKDILKSDKLLVEDFLIGWEISVFALTDGEQYVLLPPCADFKKAGEQDIGANTGGMGAICPVPMVSADLMNEIERTVIKPTFDGMKKEKLTYKGILFFGLMITEDGPKLLEYNVRFGDPETQVLLPLIKSDIVNVCEALINGKISDFPLQISSDSAVGVVVASKGYPAGYNKGIPVDSLPGTENKNSFVFHASTQRNKKGQIVTGGGRCFTVVGVGPTILSANMRAYEAVPSVVFKGAWSRTDIGQKFFI